MYFALMKYSIFLFMLVSWGCSNTPQNEKLVHQKHTINQLINQWHQNAASANLREYVDFMDHDCIYIGTDATEKWSKDEFRSFCKPYFEQKRTWNFKSLDRALTINGNNTAWFYEILETHMGTCRGSGILVFKNQEWKLKQYVLSLAIPNENMSEVKKVIHIQDSVYRSKLKK